MAAHLVDHPGGLAVCDLRPKAMAPLVEQGAVALPSPAEVAAHSGMVSVMVLDDDQTRQVVAGADGILESAVPGTVVALHSTIKADTAVELAAGRGVAVVDAPVSGGFMGAADGTLATMVGGDDDAVAVCRPIFERWAQMVVHTRTLGEKDLTLALALADETGVAAPLGRLALENFAASLGVPHDPTDRQEPA